MVSGLRGLFLASATVVAFSSLAVTLPPAQAGEYRTADVEAAVSNLYHQEPGERSSAITLLGNMGADAKAAVPKLAEIVQSDPNMAARGEAAQALGKIGSASGSAVPVLIEFMLGQEGGIERAYAATALGDIKQSPEQAVPALAKALATSDNSVVRQLAARALGDFGADARPASPELLDAIKGGDKELRDAASSAISTIPPSCKELPALIGLLDDQVDSVRLAACQSIGKAGAGAEPAVPALIKLLGDTNASIRSAAASALGGLGPVAKSALPALQKARKDAEVAAVATQAIEAIKRRQP